MNKKYIVVTGGVLSGLGKGISTSSIGKLLASRGFKAAAIKIDPYLNCDAGTMNPYQHGEVFVLDDGGEVDLDLGNYERFLEISLTKAHNITTGKVYRSVIDKERHGDYLGQTVQIIPHITNEIKDQIKNVADNSDADVVLIELGGTVGDIESMPFLEAVRQLHREVGGDANCIFVHTTLVPVVSVVGEQKTKPTQHSVKELRAIGIQPDIIIGRCDKPLEYEIKRKIALFCDVPLDGIISAPDVSSIYEVPIELEAQGLTDYILAKLRLTESHTDLAEWRKFLDALSNPKAEATVAIVGKYTYLKDSYISYNETLCHCSAHTGCKVIPQWVEAEDIERQGTGILKDAQGIIIPGGFGERGIGGKLAAINYARTHKLPFLGVCLGFQLAVIEFCRNVLDLKDAHSPEFQATTHAVVDILPEQKRVKDMGATMRLGAHPVKIVEGSIAHKLYGTTEISERHRHRYEINPEYIDKIERAGLIFTGHSPDDRRMEIFELKNHPYFMASQFHPEFKSWPGRPAPLFRGLIDAIFSVEGEGVSPRGRRRQQR